jgi:O-antigen/teichoic acid export membrane protein
LAAANIVNVLTSVITSPLIARTVGPVGRGEIAAVFAFTTVAPTISELGLVSFLTRERARAEIAKGTLVASIVPIAVLTATVVAGCAVPIAHLIGHGRNEVVRLIEIALYTLPVSVLCGCASAIAGAEGRWQLITRVQLARYVAPTIALLALAALGSLTVASACFTSIGSGLICGLPLLLVFRDAVPLRPSGAVARVGVPFGLRSWASTIAAVGNLQLDQILMAAMIPSRQLGWYALAATIGNLAGVAVNPISAVLLPRVATGEYRLMALSSRVGVALCLSFAIPAAVTAPWTIPFIFGSGFRPAVAMLAILLGASVIGAPCNILGTSLIASGRPGVTARAQLVCLGVNIGGLLYVLPRWGALGAAWVNLGANCVLLAMVLPPVARDFGMRWDQLLVVTPTDIRSLCAQIRGRRRVAISHD